jgi:uncharacterized protein (TIGR02246 family)
MKVATVVGTTLIMACASAPSVNGTAPDSQKIAADALKVFIDSWNRAAAGDMEGSTSYGTLYWPDAELVDPSGNIWGTGSDIVRMHVDLWNTAFKGSTVTGVVRRTRQLSPKLMIADFDLDLKVAGPLPPSIPNANGIVKVHLKHVMEKRGAEWKVVASQNTFVSGPPAAR